ncbi:MAG: C4-dicarboxylate TRAP transporter substrate-binding protein [Rhodospirillales bacterium]
MKHSILKMAALALAVMAFTYPASAEKKLVYANYLGLKHSTNPELEKFFKAVEKDSNGSLKWEWHFASSLLGPKDIPAGVRDGIVDAGYFVGVYVPSEMPVDNFIGDFAFLNDDAIAMTGVLNELVLFECEECADEYRDNFNTQFLGTYALTDYLFQCKEPLKSLADFKGKKARGFAGWTEMIKGMDAIPVSVSANEMYEALERGIIDCATHSITSQKTRSLGEVAHHVITNSLGGFMGASLINLRTDKWDNLTADEKTAILKNLPKLISTSVFNYVEQDITVQKEMEAKGNKFYEADPDLAKFIVDFRADFIKNKVVEKGKSRGIKDPAKILASVQRLTTKWQKLIADNGRTPESLEKLLWQEIYSKMPVK